MLWIVEWVRQSHFSELSEIISKDANNNLREKKILLKLTLGLLWQTIQYELVWNSKWLNSEHTYIFLLKSLFERHRKRAIYFSMTFSLLFLILPLAFASMQVTSCKSGLSQFSPSDTAAILKGDLLSSQVVHLTDDLKPATHQLIANEFLPDMPDNPYKSGWREEFYSKADWASVEKVFVLLLWEIKIQKSYAGSWT